MPATIAVAGLAEKIGDLRRHIAKLSDEREAAFTESDKLTERLEELSKLEPEKLSDEHRAEIDDLPGNIADQEKLARTRSDEIRKENDKLAELQQRFDSRTEHNSQTERMQQSAGRHVPHGAEPQPGTRDPESRIVVSDPSQAQLSHGLANFIRIIANSNGTRSHMIELANEHGDELNARLMEAGDVAKGGALLPDPYVPLVIENLRPRTPIRQMGVTTGPLISGKLKLPKINSGTTATYTGERGPIGVTGMTTGSVSWSAKKLSAIVPVTNDLLAWSMPAADGLIRNDLFRAIAQAENGAFIRSDGSSDTPMGLRYLVAPANVIAAPGGVTLQDIETALTSLVLALEMANVDITSPGWLMNPRTWAFLASLRDGNGNFVYPEMSQNRLKGFPAFKTTMVPANLGVGTDESEIYFLNAEDQVIAEDPRFRMEASSEAAYWDGVDMQSAFSNDETVIRVIAEHDFNTRYPESIAVLTAVTWGS